MNLGTTDVFDEGYNLKFIASEESKPPSVPGGIQLSAIPELGWTSNFFSSILACTHRVSPFHPHPARPQPLGIIALTLAGLVSVPEPELSPHILGGCLCVQWWGDFPHRP